MTSTLRSLIRVLPLAALAVPLALGFGACSDDDDQGGQDAAPPDAQMDAGLPDAAPDGAVTDPCDDLHEGFNEGFVVDGLARTFMLNLPTGVETDGPWPVVFAWHGLGDTANNFSFLLSPNVNGDYKFIGVTPNDENAMVAGINAEWDVYMVTDGATNREARLFDEVLACIEKRWGVDEDRVHSMGFSNGSIVVDLLGVIRGEQMASLATYSGGYISNEESRAGYGALANQVSWPDLTHSNTYAQLLIHGGENDTYSLFIATLHFDQFASNDATYLNDLGHDVVLCNHGRGHTAPPPEMPGSSLIGFFADHPRTAQTSPYRSGLPSSYPSYCEFLPAD